MAKITPIPFKQTKRAPAVASTYWFINGNFRVARRVWLGHKEDTQRLQRDNVFTSLKTAKSTRNKMLELLHS